MSSGVSLFLKTSFTVKVKRLRAEPNTNVLSLTILLGYVAVLSHRTVYYINIYISVGAQARRFCPKIHAQKINKMPEFYMIFGRKKYFSRFFWGGGATAPAPDPCLEYL